MNLDEHPSEAARMLGGRIRAARDAAKLKQVEFSKQLEFADRQTLSAIETGERRVQPAELVRISRLLKRPVEWFIDPFVVAGEAQFCWRVGASVPDAALDAYEERIGQIVGLLRHLRIVLRGPIPALGERLLTPTNPKAVTFEQAHNWGEAVANRLDLGAVPARLLVERIEGNFGLPVLFVDSKGPDAMSGAMCRLSNMGIIFVNRQEAASRRNFDVAHELFHALTWDVWTPKRREDEAADELDTPAPEAKRRVPRIESLADNFAAGLLMPMRLLKAAIPAERLEDAGYLAEVARQFQVSTVALGYRLLNANLISKQTQLTLDSIRLENIAETPKLLSAPFARLISEGIAEGHVSARKVAKALAMTLEEVAELLSAYGEAVPFEI